MDGVVPCTPASAHQSLRAVCHPVSQDHAAAPPVVPNPSELRCSGAVNTTSLFFVLKAGKSQGWGPGKRPGRAPHRLSYVKAGGLPKRARPWPGAEGRAARAAGGLRGPGIKLHAELKDEAGAQDPGGPSGQSDVQGMEGQCARVLVTVGVLTGSRRVYPPPDARPRPRLLP